MGTYRFLVWLVVPLLAASCGVEVSETSPVAVGQPAVRAQLVLFGAPWCTNCKRDFPKIRDLIAGAPAAAKAGLAMKLYVETGGRATDRPTPQIAEAYRAYFKLNAQAIADPWRWKTFRQYVGENLDLPGAAVLDAKGKVLRAYPAGPATFIPSEIVAFALRAAK